MKNKTISFVKLVASGNDFVLLDLRIRKMRLNLKETARQFCNRKLGIGADGLLVLEKSRKATVKMRIFNADGSEAEMCGNGARCVAYFLKSAKARSRFNIETKAGILNAQANKDNVRINMTEPRNIKLDSVIKLNKYNLRFNFINTGVPHAVILCEGLEKINVYSLGRLIRFHNKFKPQGTNVDFIEPDGLDSLKIRTYERGVEEETLACGTGSVAGAIIYARKLKNSGLTKKDKFNIDVETVSGEVLKVSFEMLRDKIKNVWLEGKARIVHKGVYYA
ncbi:MAG: diaminopimelate epimerase [Candidatus Omnitrophica bacterium]|nr:diaminopimelate epimerase [Candidatus Omnitrophota bacterium]MDD5352685.1 diaminopimelate epimerase [Candidatus Omnitrophota bacterium]MDD5550284.1 diaminopimelate epimerase [Candidatus Omnitrophota bacterium]